MILDGPLRTIIDRFVDTSDAIIGVTRPPGLGIATGSISGTRLDVTGYNNKVNAITMNNVPVWYNCTNISFPTGDQTLKVSSSSANDDVGSSGATSVRIWWLDSANVQSTTDVDLDGVNLVVSGAITARRVNRVEVLTVGATGGNEGVITVYATDGATPLAHINVGAGVSEHSWQTVPSGYKDVIWKAWTFSGYLSSSAGMFRYRTSAASPWLTICATSSANGYSYISDIDFDIPLVFAAGTDYQAINYVGTANAFHAAGFSGYRIAV